MKATVQPRSPDAPARTFVAQAIEYGVDTQVWALGRVHGVEPCEAFIWLALPVDFSGESVPVAPPDQDAAQVYVAFNRVGYAEQGWVTDIVWDQAARVFSGRFACEGADQEVGRFEVLNGEFTIHF